MRTTGLVKASNGSASLTANSPLEIGPDGVEASGNVTLVATNLTSAGSITLNGNVTSSGGSVALNAANTIVAEQRGFWCYGRVGQRWQVRSRLDRDAQYGG
jgi:hypothetical protein